MLDWLACAYGGRGQRAAPAAIALAAELGLAVEDALDAYSTGFEAMGALSRARDLYAGGWHPTAVSGAAGAAHAAAMAAAASVHAARLAAGGATITADVAGHPAGFDAAFGAAQPDDGRRAVEENWIKPWPCCLMAHSAVQAASEAREALAGSRAPIDVAVHPVARRAAAYDEVADGLQAKLSIPYLVAYVVLHGEPVPASFDAVDPAVSKLARDRVRLTTDDGLRQAEAVLALDADEVARVPASRGSPEAPLDAADLARKTHLLAGERLDGLLDDPDAPAQSLVDALAR